MGLSHQEALERLDAEEIGRNQDVMVLWVEAEVARLDRMLTTEEALALLRSKLNLQTDATYYLVDWIQSTDVDVEDSPGGHLWRHS